MDKTDNELIAEFMGLPINTKYGLEVQLPPDNPSKEGAWTRPQYDTSWDWLMPVVEKIETLRMDVTIKHFITNNEINVQECLIDDQSGNTIAYREGKTKIDATCKAVVEFIKWYNENAKHG